MVTFVRVGALAAALGVTRQTLSAWVRSSKIEAPAGAPGEVRRWPVATAIEILTSRRCPVPVAWTAEKIGEAA